MGQTPFFNSSLPPSQEFGLWGRIRNAILGNGRGKFRSDQFNYWPVNQRVILSDTSPGSLMTVAMEVPHLNTVLSTGAELFSLMDIKHLDKNGEEIENSSLLQFLQHPNPLQSREQFLYEFYVLNGVYNKTFQHKLLGASFQVEPSALWLLPSGWMKINTTGKIYRQTDINEIIENFEMMNDPEKFETDRIIYMAEGVGNNILNPISRIESLQIPLSNIVASLKSRNIITTERGMIGFISHNPQTVGNEQLPPDTKEAERNRKEYQRQYSLDGQGGHVGFTTADVKWVPMTFNIQELGLLEGLEDDFSAIIAAYRHDRDLYPSVKGATFENKDAGMRSTIQNGLQPLADKLMRQWTKHFINPLSGESLKASYKHLLSMSKDARLAAQGNLYRAQSAEIALHNGVIGHEQFARILDYDFDGDGIIKALPKAPIQNNPADDNPAD